ncbi:DUF362 domain-containing protein [bacterium]|nr:DUF362 domain-containing protein [bacterium]
MKTYPVYLGACDTYDSAAIHSVLKTALDHVTPARPPYGKVVIKPNLVMAHPRVATDGFTRPEVVEGVIRLVRETGNDVERIDISEASGLGITTGGGYRWAGYRRLKKLGVRMRAMEEHPQKVVTLEKGRLHKHLTLTAAMADRDFLIFVPKLKTNVLAHAYTGALKLNIGTVDSRERMLFHDYRLPQKIVDILEAANPDLIVTDGIRFSYGGNQMTQGGVDFGLIAVSTNAVAHDMVCARLIGLDPFKIEHIKEAMDRGYGPTSFSEIEVAGDYPRERAAAIVKDLDFGFYPVDRFPSNFRIVSGTPYCTGGCQGILLDWLHMIRDRKPKLLKRFPRLTVLVGKVTENIEDRIVVLIGDCARASTTVSCRRKIVIAGCPPTHKRIVWDMMVNLLLLAPLVRPSLIIDGFVAYPLKKIKGWLVNSGKRT